MLLLGCAPLLAQKSEQLPQDDPDLPSLLASPVPNVPGLKARLSGFNVASTFTSVHDSSSGWYTLYTPAVSYAVSPHYSFDANIAVYLYRLAADQVTTTRQQQPSPGQPNPQPVQDTYTTDLRPHRGELGDLVLAAHMNLSPKWFRYTLTPSMTVPTGDVDHGLSTGRVTFDINNHFETRSSRGGFLLDLGGGDSSSLFNRLVTKDYTSLGPLAHFSVGGQVFLPLRMVFQSVAYEQLPLGDGKIYTTLSRPGYPDRTFVTGRSVSEDNGFTNSLVVPLNSHVTLQSYYNRSLRLELDTVSMGITFTLKSNRPKRRRSLLLDEGVLR
ncbi:hypothetical protein ACFQBQ_05655 [Granulicella cerasi]|uniref:Uncharacterized protein n=1 Tax=Granulicella cerasi TaxID=741063 RepID=A0ABW1Z693_9BACT|nr:hypothetical protein [Granulicella cerasi]